MSRHPWGIIRAIDRYRALKRVHADALLLAADIDFTRRQGCGGFQPTAAQPELDF
jgi:hypothetical protein